MYWDITDPHLDFQQQGKTIALEIMVLFKLWICVQELFLCLQHHLGGSGNAFAGLNPAQGLVCFLIGFFWLCFVDFFFYSSECYFSCSCSRQKSSQTRDPLQMQAVAKTFAQQFQTNFPSYFPSLWTWFGFFLWAERCQKCSACLWSCKRHPQGCVKNSWGACGQLSGVHGTVLGTHRTNGIRCCDQHMVSLLHIFHPQDFPPAYEVSIQKGHIYYCLNHCEGAKLLFSLMSKLLGLLMGEDSSGPAFN